MAGNSCILKIAKWADRYEIPRSDVALLFEDVGFSPSFAKKDEYAAFQAADLLAFEYLLSNRRLMQEGDEEPGLRKAIYADGPEHMPEFDLALNTGLRLSEQYGRRWEDVSLPLRMLTIPRTKNGSVRYLPLNQAAVQALEQLRKQNDGSHYVCGSMEPRRWFERVLKDAKVMNFSWHCLRHTFASRLVMAGVDLRTLQELLGHKTIAMTVRYAHLAPKHTMAAVERLDVPIAGPTDTTTDTADVPKPAAELVVLQ